MKTYFITDGKRWTLATAPDRFGAMVHGVNTLGTVTQVRRATQREISVFRSRQPFAKPAPSGQLA